MHKQAFLDQLAALLRHVPPHELARSLEYYNEIIVDRMEDGMSEEEAVAALGPLDAIVEGILYEMPLPALIAARVNESKDKSSNKRLWMILAILGIPIWLPLLLAGACVVLSIYIAIWAVFLSLYAVVFALGISGVAGLLSGFVLWVTRGPAVGLCLIGAALVCGALTLFMVSPVLAMTKNLVHLTAVFAKKLKSFVIAKKEEF